MSMQSLRGSMNQMDTYNGGSSDIGLETIKLLLKKRAGRGIYKSNFSNLESLKKQHPNNLFVKIRLPLMN